MPDKAWYTRRFKAGTCRACSRPRVKPYAMCSQCRELHRERLKDRYDRIYRGQHLNLPVPPIKPHVPTPRSHPVRSLVYLPPAGSFAQQFFGRVIPPVR